MSAHPLRCSPSLIRLAQNSFYALYRSFTECCFIEDDGEIVFYKNQHGVAQRELGDEAIHAIKKEGWTQEGQDQLADGAVSDSTRTE